MRSSVNSRSEELSNLRWLGVAKRVLAPDAISQGLDDVRCFRRRDSSDRVTDYRGDLTRLAHLWNGACLQPRVQTHRRRLPARGWFDTTVESSGTRIGKQT